MNILADSVFKKSFLEGYTNTDINTATVTISLLLTVAIAVYIFMVYRLLTRKAFYSKSFNVALAGIAIITAAIILVIQSSIVVSLGMVGALSIVRFRTAIKDPLDLMFLFWSLSTGIICGAGYAEYGIILAIILTVVVIVLDKAPIGKAPMILIVNSSNHEIEDSVCDCIAQYSKVCNIKSRNFTQNTLDMTIEVRTKDGGKLVKDIMELPGIDSASLLQHDGEATF